jgi:hypothetical protein
MDEDGFIFTIDAVLMLIPIFILVAAVANINLVVSDVSPYYKVQDGMNAFFLSDINNSVISNATVDNFNNVQGFANKSVVLKSFKSSYNFTYTLSNGTTQIISQKVTNINPDATQSSSVRRYGNVTFRLTMWADQNG